jgi:hypothetical protein
LFLHSSRWHSLSVRNSGRSITGEFLHCLTHSIDLKSLESLNLVSPIHGHLYMIANFQSGVCPESGSALHHLILRDMEVQALHLMVDNVVTLTLSSITEEDDPQFWAHILGSSDKLKCLILSCLRYPHDGMTGAGAAFPASIHLHSLVLGYGNRRRFFRYMIQELNTPPWISVLWGTEQYADEITRFLMAFVSP